MRFIFVDESGTGDPDREPHVVVAAAIVNADKQLKALELYLSQTAEEFVPKETRHLFKGFHANELYSGGKAFPRDPEKFGKWRHILDELATIPQKFDLPISWGFVPRHQFMPGGLHHAHAVNARIDPLVVAQMAAFATASVGVDHWFNKAADPDEIGQMVLENNEQSKRLIRQTNAVLTRPKSRQFVLPDEVANLRGVSRIRGPVYFEEKGESNGTQLADFLAWTLRRHLCGEQNSARYCDPILPFLVNKLKDSQDGVILPALGQRALMQLVP